MGYTPFAGEKDAAAKGVEIAVRKSRRYGLSRLDQSDESTGARGSV